MTMRWPQPRWQHSSAVRITSVLPVASKLYSAPPSVNSITFAIVSSRDRPFELRKCVIPNLRPHASRSGLMSTPMIRPAPTIFALDDVEPDPAQPEHDDILAGLHPGGVDHRADPGGDAAADIAARLEGRVLA